MDISSAKRDSLYADLVKFQSKRKFPDWKPKANAGKIKLSNSPQEQVLLRCLEFVDLELQVGAWVNDINTSEAKKTSWWSDYISPILERNIQDELKHDDAIRYLQDYYQFNGRQSLGSVNLRKMWREVDDHPVVATYALEMGVFFTILPILMKCGDVYAATIASWINDDERVHVETNLRLIKYFGFKLSPEIVKLVFDTVSYLYNPLGEEKSLAEATRACKRLVTTKDPQMLTESLPITISYFEQNTNSDIVYS